jgi:5-methylthioribose kinase
MSFIGIAKEENGFLETPPERRRQPGKAGPTRLVSLHSENPLNIEERDELIRYLRFQKIIPLQSDPVVRTLEGGVSNRTVLVESKEQAPFVVKQALSKLRVEADWFSDPLRIHREARGLEWLHKLAPAGAITPLLFEDRSHHLIGMAAVPEPHYNWKRALLEGEINLDYVDQFANLLGTIHRESLQHRTAIADVFSDRSFFESLRIEPYYRYSAGHVPETRAFFDDLIAETFETRLTIVHGDYSPKNILVREGQLVLLDHEVIHFGDPAFDVGFSLTHLLSKAHHVAHRRAEFLQAAQRYTKRYLEHLDGLEWRDSAERRAVRHAIGCLLARAAGRSPLEYLTPEERVRQNEIARHFTLQPARRLSDLIDAFSEELACR